ncbi:MAG TPA: TlpA disulfide reductase family protein [Chitinophagaceae bacterium]|nr:TlpA disulfide reductase family protein [Chitinophagaceae bacterium]
MIKPIITISISLILVLASSYLASFGHNMKMIFGYISFTLFTFFILRKSESSKKTIQSIFIALPIIILLMPAYILDYENTKLSLPSSIALLVGVISGFFLTKHKTSFVSITLTVIIAFMYFKGYSLWANNIMYGWHSNTNTPINTFYLSTVNGYKLSNASWKEEIVVLNFWNSHCKPCIKEFPEFNQLIEKYKQKKILFYGVNVPITKEDTKETALELLNKYEAKFENIYSSYLDKTTSVFEIKIYPTVLVIEKNKILFKGSLKNCEKFLSLKFNNL